MTPIRTVAILMMLAFAPLSYAANVVATVDRNQVGVNESFRLTFEADDTVGAPDFSVLDKDFEILDSSQNQSISITNGRTSRKHQWDLVLMATKEGVFQIPPISFGGVMSQPISVVVKAGTEVSEADKKIFLDVEVDVEQPYVQQQVIYTVRLFRSVEISSATLSEPSVEGVDALVEPFGDDENYQMVRNGRRWLVVERKYLVFPQQRGYLTIRPLEFRGQVVDRRSSLGLSLFNQPTGKPVVLRSESVTIAVREQPPSFAGPWLPAKRLELSESWPETGELTVGEPVTRSITATALGLTAAQLPELDPGLPEGLRAYPEQPSLEDSGRAEGVLGSRTQSMAIIPTRAGRLTLPEVKVAWWNVDAGQPEIATLPARTIDVAAAPAAAVTATRVQPVPVIQETPASAGEAAPKGPDSRGWWRWSTFGLGLLWLATLMLWLADRSRRATTPATGPRREPPGPDPKKALSRVDRACKTGDAQGVKSSLLRWGAAVWPENPPLNLGRLAARCDASLAESITDLERHLYGHGGSWDPGRLSARLRAFKRADDSAPNHKGVSLEPLYRT